MDIVWVDYILVFNSIFRQPVSFWGSLLKNSCARQESVFTGRLLLLVAQSCINFNQRPSLKEGDVMENLPPGFMPPPQTQQPSGGMQMAQMGQMMNMDPMAAMPMGKSEVY